ncbi:D-lactate dehydrogenase (cytochrome) [Angomonas deanei]|uniref:FAD linked oxidases, C-terminal domain containing protein, putative n=1 Tax=Angomonas deanei TaxID=59799 RepID=A0A7G2CNR8_9TRYP|nr:D-lactate dehydrogenase (cytochrome) [Angomonas deanei]CAD2221498.1 FAD linked oxidases, C-terminal domain containing protein, putative [Angomonas deanei]|eukprot:EPY38963.1 D-lactate dehydrogenase (cytochrome) [Angomonas deanei]
MVSTSGSGMSTLRYGTTRENVISLVVVNHKGDIIKTRQNVRKSSAGLELTQLYIGSEGTLAIVCEVCFRLFTFEKYNAGAYASFETTEDAVRAVVAMRLKGDSIRTVVKCEMMNKWNMESTNAYSKMSLPLTATVLLEFTTNDRRLRDVKEDYRTIAALFKQVGKAKIVKYLQSGKELDSYWSARRSCYFAARLVRGKGVPEKVFTGDVCVPLTALAEIVAYTEAIFEQDNKKCLICAHIADGNFHLNIPYTSPQEHKELQALEDKMIKKAIELGGTISGEHGIGVSRVKLVTLEHGPHHVDVQEKIKKALDPDNRMNAGAFYPSQQLLYPTAHL